MADEVVKFDPNSLKDQVTAKVRLAVMDLIPEEAWQAMVKNAIKEFCEPVVVKGRYQGDRDTTEPSGLSVIVKQVMTKEIAARVETVLKEEWQTMNTWSPETGAHAICVNAKITELIKEAAPDIVTALLSRSIQTIVNSMAVPR